MEFSTNCENDESGKEGFRGNENGGDGGGGDGGGGEGEGGCTGGGDGNKDGGKGDGGGGDGGGGDGGGGDGGGGDGGGGGGENKILNIGIFWDIDCFTQNKYIKNFKHIFHNVEKK